MTDKLYLVLRPGIRQRTAEGWRRPDVGDRINVSDDGAEPLIRNGFIKPVTDEPTTDEEGGQA